MKKTLYILLMLLLSIGASFAQNDEEQRISKLKQQLEILAVEVSGLNDVYKTEIDATNLTLSNLLLAVADVHKLNINPSEDLDTPRISPSFPNVIVSDLLIFLCKEYNLTIDFTGTIMSVKNHVKEIKKPEERIIPITYNLNNNTISIDAKDDKLYDVFKLIMDKSGKNLVFSPGLENNTITAYIQQTPFDAAMDNLAFANNLYVAQSKDGFYVFENNDVSEAATIPNNASKNQVRQRPTRRRNSNFFFKVIDLESKLLEVDFVNTSISDIINDIGNDLSIDVFTATPLDEAGTVTFKTKSITFDDLLTKLFEVSATIVVESDESKTTSSRSPKSSGDQNSNSQFNFKKENNIYYFGKEDQLSIREVVVIKLKHRTVELLSDPSGNLSSRSAGRSNYASNGRGSNINNFDRGTDYQRTQRTERYEGSGSQPLDQNTSSLKSIIPNELKSSLKIIEDYELNSFYVTGPSAKIKRFRDFIEQIDKPIPLIQIEVMILEVSKTSSVEAGVSWGIGNEPTTTRGGVFPETDLTLGANTINRIIGGFGSFGGVNIGRVVPNFFATIKAMESNGDLKIRSTPRLSTLNGHRAYFSNGQTSYYAITDQAIIGSDNPVTQTATNYVPIDAELGLTIKPTVSGDGQVTLDISVIQSSFGNRISEDAPPDINSREFSSLIRMKDQDIAVLGGLEEQSRSNSGSGVPFLARIPVIKWLFSKRVREAKKAKLTVLIRPTVIN